MTTKLIILPMDDEAWDYYHKSHQGPYSPTGAYAPIQPETHRCRCQVVTVPKPKPKPKRRRNRNV